MSSTPPSDRPAGPPPVRLVAADGAFSPGRSVAFARIAGDGLRDLDIRHGDHVVLERREQAEHGDLAAVLDEEGRAHLWKVFPERDDEGRDRLRLSCGHPAFDRWTAPGARVQGVVVAVLRRAVSPEGAPEGAASRARRATWETGSARRADGDSRRG